ncbi:LysR family transcriptional regulator [Oceanicella sp. SM1341]|uniref:LysR family transcriptional regulator n=1 Tax=Oceanicella sp. SM1341 TaxID=1548889 RepID=UPI0018E59679|nr:LysR family transcriptional regulator [Oceanicella sp. SM1341]
MDASRLDWNDLRIFLHVAREGSLTAAGRTLRLSQPTVGRRLRSLEEACGLPLFQRGAAGFVLTEDGEALVLAATAMEERVLGLVRHIAGRGETLEGNLRVSSSDWFLQHVLSTPCAGFVARHPGVTLELLADVRLLDLDRREADLVFRFQPFTAPGIVQRHFTSVAYGLYAAPAYLERSGPPRAGEAGAGHSLVAMDQQFDRVADMDWLRRHFPHARIALRSSSRELQALACAQGAGLAVLPVIIAGPMGLARIEAFGAPPGRELWMGFHADLKRLARLRALIDHLVASVPAQI